MNLDGRAIGLFPSRGPGAPLVVLIADENEGPGVWEAARAQTDADFTMAAVGGFDWNGDLTPWPAPPLSPRQPPFGGRGEGFLNWLTERALPEILSALPRPPAWTGIAGYSLAGLFALYALHGTAAFSRAASASGSLWYPGFAEYAASHAFARRPDRVYLSVGDRERMTKNAAMKPVEDNTRRMAALYRAAGIPARFELNPGGHFKDPERRMGRGIAWILQ